jgi:hypothetical protein
MTPHRPCTSPPHPPPHTPPSPPHSTTTQGEGEVKILGRLARNWDHVAPGDSHVILGDDADLVLMALVGATEGLYVVNAALNDGDLSPQMAAFSVDVFHRHEVERFVHKDAVFPRVSGCCAGGCLSCVVLHAVLPWHANDLP